MRFDGAPVLKCSILGNFKVIFFFFVSPKESLYYNIIVYNMEKKNTFREIILFLTLFCVE